MGIFKGLFDYREMIIELVKRDIRGRYKKSILGFLWMLLNPMLQLAVYTVVFSKVMRMDIDQFYLFIFVALVPWIFFSTCLTSGSTIFCVQQTMIKKVSFPREVLPVSFTISQFVNMLLSFIVIFAAVLFSGRRIDPLALLMLPLVMAIEFVLALGIVFITATVNVYFRDLEHILGIVSMMWMYLTPVIYPAEMVPEEYRLLFWMNPMTSVVTAYRDILYYGRMPMTNTLLVALFMGVIILTVGVVIFVNLQKGFAEEM